MNFKWLKIWARKLLFSISMRISWPDASRDRCLECQIERAFHGGANHKFMETK